MFTTMNSVTVGVPVKWIKLKPLSCSYMQDGLEARLLIVGAPVQIDLSVHLCLTHIKNL